MYCWLYVADLRPRDAADAPQGACTASTRRPTELLIFILTLNFVKFLLTLNFVNFFLILILMTNVTLHKSRVAILGITSTHFSQKILFWTYTTSTQWFLFDDNRSDSYLTSLTQRSKKQQRRNVNAQGIKFFNFQKFKRILNGFPILFQNCVRGAINMR